MLGKISVGKSAVISQYVDGIHKKTQATIGLDTRYKIVNTPEQIYQLELWDTAGHERYRTIVYNYFFLSQAAAVVFDLTDPSSLDEAKVWLQQV